ncbi:MAG: TRAP transporter substrate-binding protein DctP [Myxococcales bacterium]|nr:TRAP transporter substrate-binding protein DctP [Myxococcales bacterium]
MRYSLALALASLLLVSAPMAAQARVEIKIATVAPRGSMWMRLFNKMKARILKATKGEVKIRYYPGQVQGDERDVVRKMRTGQLHGGAFTAIGLGLINPKVLILQMPMMFKDTAQLDRVRDKLAADFEKTFNDKGYILLGWGEVGPVYFFSKVKVTSLAGLRERKVWAWSDDPVAKTTLRKLGVKPRLLGLPQVLPSLNTGIVDTVYNSPLGLLALQWHSKVKYMGAEPYAIGIGATVVTKKAWSKLSAEQQKVVMKISRRYHRAMIKRVRRDNERALKALLGNFGIKKVPLPAGDMKVFRKAAKKVRKAFVPRYYSKGLLDKVLSTL